MTGEETRAPNKKLLIRKITVALEGREDAEPCNEGKAIWQAYFGRQVSHLMLRERERERECVCFLRPRSAV